MAVLGLSAGGADPVRLRRLHDPRSARGRLRARTCSADGDVRHQPRRADRPGARDRLLAARRPPLPRRARPRRLARGCGRDGRWRRRVVPSLLRTRGSDRPGRPPVRAGSRSSARSASAGCSCPLVSLAGMRDTAACPALAPRTSAGAAVRRHSDGLAASRRGGDEEAAGLPRIGTRRAGGDGRQRDDPRRDARLDLLDPRYLGVRAGLRAASRSRRVRRVAPTQIVVDTGTPGARAIRPRPGSHRPAGGRADPGSGGHDRRQRRARPVRRPERPARESDRGCAGRLRRGRDTPSRSSHPTRPRPGGAIPARRDRRRGRGPATGRRLPGALVRRLSVARPRHSRRYVRDAGASLPLTRAAVPGGAARSPVGRGGVRPARTRGRAWNRCRFAWGRAVRGSRGAGSQSPCLRCCSASRWTTRCSS